MGFIKGERGPTGNPGLPGPIGPPGPIGDKGQDKEYDMRNISHSDLKNFAQSFVNDSNYQFGINNDQLTELLDPINTKIDNITKKNDCLKNDELLNCSESQCELPSNNNILKIGSISIHGDNNNLSFINQNKETILKLAHNGEIFADDVKIHDPNKTNCISEFIEKNCALDDNNYVDSMIKKYDLFKDSCKDNKCDLQKIFKGSLDLQTNQSSSTTKTITNNELSVGGNSININIISDLDITDNTGKTLFQIRLNGDFCFGDICINHDIVKKFNDNSLNCFTQNICPDENNLKILNGDAYFKIQDKNDKCLTPNTTKNKTDKCCYNQYDSYCDCYKDYCYQATNGIVTSFEDCTNTQYNTNQQFKLVIDD